MEYPWGYSEYCSRVFDYFPHLVQVQCNQIVMSIIFDRLSEAITTNWASQSTNHRQHATNIQIVYNKTQYVFNVYINSNELTKHLKYSPLHFFLFLCSLPFTHISTNQDRINNIRTPSCVLYSFTALNFFCIAKPTEHGEQNECERKH